MWSFRKKKRERQTPMFRLVRRGYDPDEVLCFIESMAESLETYAESQYKNAGRAERARKACGHQAGRGGQGVDRTAYQNDTGAHPGSGGPAAQAGAGAHGRRLNMPEKERGMPAPGGAPVAKTAVQVYGPPAPGGGGGAPEAEPPAEKRILCAAAAAVAALLALSLALDRMVGLCGSRRFHVALPAPGRLGGVPAGPGEVKAGQLVLFPERCGKKEPLVKRVTALPGQTVEVLESGAVLVDGRPLEEPLRAFAARPQGTPPPTPTVPAGALFVSGDNRATSMDSRNAELGAVAQQAVLGRVIAVWRTSP